MSKLIKEAADIIIERIERLLPIAQEEVSNVCEDNPFIAGLVYYIRVKWDQYEPSLREGLKDNNTLSIRLSGRGNSLDNCRIEEEMTLDLLSLTKEDVEECIGGLLREWGELKVQGQAFGGLFDYKCTIHAEINLLRSRSDFVVSRNSITVIDENRKQMRLKKIHDFVANKEYETLSLIDYNNSYHDVLHITTNEFFDEFGREKLGEFIEALLKQASLLDKKRVAQRISYKRLMNAFVFAAKGLIAPEDDENGKHSPERVEYGVDLLLPVLLNSDDESILDDVRELLKSAGKQKNKRAKDILSYGTGLISTEFLEYKDENVSCLANDIEKCVTFKLKTENEEAYKAMLEYLIKLMGSPFPKDYQIKINTAHKNFLPVSGLHKSPMHKFWVNCASYKNLHPYMEKYIRIMIDNHDYYLDGGRNDENPMSTGGYAVLALAINFEEYGKLLADYLVKNESYDHNILSNAAIETYIAKWGVTAENLETILVCMQWYDGLNPKKADFSGFKTSEVINKLNARNDIADYILKRIHDYTK